MADAAPHRVPMTTRAMELLNRRLAARNAQDDRRGKEKWKQAEYLELLVKGGDFQPDNDPQSVAEALGRFISKIEG